MSTLSEFEEKRKVWTINRLRGSHHMVNTGSSLNSANSRHRSNMASLNLASSLPHNSNMANPNSASHRSSRTCREIRIG